MASAKDRVLEKYPTAFVDDDGESVRIRQTKTFEGLCPHCRQSWNHQVTDYEKGALGAGSTESAAWEDAAKNLPAVVEAAPVLTASDFTEAERNKL
jgi:hypothetical protein